MASALAPPQAAPPDLGAARARLGEPAPRRGSAWAMLGASALAAGSGLALCAAVFAGAADLPSARPAPAPSLLAAHVAHP